MSDEEQIEETPPEQTIPKVRFDEATGKLKDELRQINEALQNEREARIRAEERQETPAETLSHAELQNQVDEGVITQAQANAIAEKQLTEKITANLRKEYSTATLTQKVGEEISKYRELLDLETHSDDWNKIKKEYEYLVSIGQPANASTQLVAIRNKFGSLDKVRKLKETPETHQETGGNAPPETNDNPLKLNARQKAYYEKRIGTIYKNWDEVKEELKYAR